MKQRNKGMEEHFIQEQLGKFLHFLNFQPKTEGDQQGHFGKKAQCSYNYCKRYTKLEKILWHKVPTLRTL